MAAAALTLLEARTRVPWLASLSASPQIATSPEASDTQNVIQTVTGILRACDDVLLALDPAAASDRGEAGLLMSFTRGLRNAYYLLLSAWAPELTSYWHMQRQAQLRAADRNLTSQARARLREDPVAWSQLRAEEALWEGTTADGLDDE